MNLNQSEQYEYKAYNKQWLYSCVRDTLVRKSIFFVLFSYRDLALIKSLLTYCITSDSYLIRC